MLQDHIKLIKGQIAHFQSEIRRIDPHHPRYKPGQIALYERLVRQHQELLGFLETLSEADSDEPPAFSLRLEGGGLPVRARTDGLADLPPELLNELSTSATKGPTDILVTIIEERGGTATLDDILIDMYRKHGEVGKRTVLSNRLYRLRDRDLVWPVPGKKGLYTTTKPASAATAKVLDFSNRE